MSAYQEAEIRPLVVGENSIEFGTRNDDNVEREREEIVVEHETECVEIGLVLGILNGEQIARREETVDEDEHVAEQIELEISPPCGYSTYMGVSEGRRDEGGTYQSTSSRWRAVRPWE